MKIEEYEAAAEAILFAMGDSVEIKKLAFALQVNEREAELILRNLADRYQADNCGLQILELDGAYLYTQTYYLNKSGVRFVQSRLSMNI